VEVRSRWREFFQRSCYLEDPKIPVSVVDRAAASLSIGTKSLLSGKRRCALVLFILFPAIPVDVQSQYNPEEKRDNILV
jgi:hypothetical protein